MTGRPWLDGARCSYCGHTAQLATCCQAHPADLICRLCREAKRPGNHRPPASSPRRPRADERQPPFATQRSPRLHPDAYHEMVDALMPRPTPLVGCTVCGGLMLPNRQRAHTACLTPGARDVAPVPAGARLVDVVGSEAWRGGVADAVDKLTALEAPLAAEPPSALEPLHGPPRPVDVALDPAKAWTDWGAAVLGAFAGSTIVDAAPAAAGHAAPGALEADDGVTDGPQRLRRPSNS